VRVGSFVVTFVSLAAFTLSCGPTPPSPSAGAPAAEQARAAAPKRIVAAIRGDPLTLSDSINWAASGSTVAGVDVIEQLLHSGLLLVDGQGELQPLLAEAVPTVENGLWKVFPDGRMETTWKLKPNVAWHDGQPLTSEDLLFAASVVQDRDVAIRPDQAFRFIEAMHAPDARTFVVTWKSPYIDADKLFTQSTETRNLPMPRHLLESSFLEDRAGITQSAYFAAEYVGAGPFRLKEWVFGSHLVVEANDRYVLGRPKVDEITVKFVLDTNTMVANLMAGAIDLTLGRQAVNEEQAIVVRDQWKDGVVQAPLQNTTALYPQFLNPDPLILQEVQFRRALLHALDRQQIVDTFMAGLVPVAHSIISPDDPDYRHVEARVVRYPYEPARAIELLDGLGLTKGPDGIYRDSANRPLTIEVRTRANPLREKLQQVISEDWRRVGVLVDAAVIPEQRIRDRAYQAEHPGFYFRAGGPTQFPEWLSREAPLAENNYVGVSPIRYRNTTYDGLVERFLTTIPRAERMRALGEIAHYATDQLLILPVFHESVPALVSNKLLNIDQRRGVSIQAWNAHEWDVRSGS